MAWDAFLRVATSPSGNSFWHLNAVSSGGGSVGTEDEGVVVDASASLLNFVGAGVNAAGGSGTTTITIPGSISGTLASRPAAAAANQGMLYYGTDSQLVYLSDGSSWTAVTLSESAVANLVADLAAKASTTDLTNGLIPSQISSILALGHSWLAGANLGSTGTPAFEQNGLLARLAGMLGVHNDNIQDGAVSGALLTQPTNFLGTIFCGWSYPLAFVMPPTSALTADTSFTVNTATPQGPPGLGVVVHGVNDFQAYNPASATTLSFMQTAWQVALRTTLSRMRAGLLFSSFLNSSGTATWDSAIAFSGGTNQAPIIGQGTGPLTRVSTTNGDTITLTLPANLPANCIVSMCFIGTPNPLPKLTSANMNNTDVSTNVTNSGDNFTGGDIVYDVNNPTELMKVTTAGAGSATLSRGFNGTTKTTHNTGTFFAKYQGATVNFSGSAANATGSLAVDGVGVKTATIAIIKRFICTSADAGKTIIATTAGILASAPNQSVTFDSAWVESLDPALCVVANLPRFNYTIINSTATFTDITNFNAATASVIAEFDGAIKLADIDTPVFNRGAVLGTTLNNTDVTTAGVALTANSDFPAAVGTVITDRSEDMLITAISGSFPNYTVTLSRGYNSTGKTTHSSGNVVSDTAWWYVDHLHPSAVGAGVFAQVLYATTKTFTGLSPYQIAHTTGNYIQDSQKPLLGLRDNYYLAVNLNTNLTRSTTFTLNKLWYFPFYIPQWCLLAGVAILTGTTTAGVGTAARFGLYDLATDRFLPGALIQELGTAATTSTNVVAEASTYKVLQPGWYYFAVVNQGTTAGTISTMTALTWDGDLPYYAAATPLPSGFQPFISDTGSITGALPTTASPTMDAGPFPTIWPHIRTKTYG